LRAVPFLDLVAQFEFAQRVTIGGVVNEFNAKLEGR